MDVSIQMERLAELLRMVAETTLLLAKQSTDAEAVELEAAARNIATAADRIRDLKRGSTH